MVKIFLVMAVIITFVLINEMITQKNKSTFIAIEDDSDYAYQIEDMFLDNDYLVIKGWFFELNSVRNIKQEILPNKKLGILLYELNSEDDGSNTSDSGEKKGIITEMEYMQRSDINEYFKCEFDYTQCGFIAKTKIDNIDLEKQYQIIIKPDYSSNVGILSIIYFYDGTLQRVTKNDKPDLNVERTDLYQIIHDGILVAGNSEYGMWVYQYKDSFYWIADTYYNFEDDGSTYIQYQMDTTQFDKLPKERIENQWFFSDIGGNFEDYEITNDINCGQYRVSVREIPKEYSVVRIETGYYIEDRWIWRRFIRPYYNFK